jgi:hypothetical protein
MDSPIGSGLLKKSFKRVEEAEKLFFGNYAGVVQCGAESGYVTILTYYRFYSFSCMDS